MLNEKLIGGKMHYQTEEDGHWIPYTLEQLSIIYAKLKEEKSTEIKVTVPAVPYTIPWTEIVGPYTYPQPDSTGKEPNPSPYTISFISL